jgi:hypothetical protein
MQSKLKKDIDSFYLEQLDRHIARQRKQPTETINEEVTTSNNIIKKSKSFYKEDSELFDNAVTFGQNDENPDADEAEPEVDPDADIENIDAMDEADEILSQINLTDISNGIRLELIEAIIDSAQNAVDGDDANDDAFTDFMQSIQDVIDSFRYDGEESEEPVEDLGEEPAEDLEEEPMEEPAETSEI